MKSIEVSNLSFFYQDEKKILDNISFDINKGEYVAIVGPNGSGKSNFGLALFDIVGLLTDKQVEKSVNDIININMEEALDFHISNF